ncbi:MAG TPA: hypothetical protein VMU47_07160 [Caldimonas sp.]|nr:hypothetical protein [Caldimonas sp.]
MTYTLLVFVHLIAGCIALGAIVATDLRMLSRLAHDRVRIPPPNGFVARLVTTGLALLWATGAAIVWRGLDGNPAYVTPKLAAKVLLVVLLTLNAWLLHRLTFPRLALGRRVGRWKLADYAIVAPPVALSNCLWLFCAFLGIARPWNRSMTIAGVVEIAVVLYAATLLLVIAVLLVAGIRESHGWLGASLVAVKRGLGAIGRLGESDDGLGYTDAPPRRSEARRSRPPERTERSLPSALPPSIVLLNAYRRARESRRRA